MLAKIPGVYFQEELTSVSIGPILIHSAVSIVTRVPSAQNDHTHHSPVTNPRRFLLGRHWFSSLIATGKLLSLLGDGLGVKLPTCTKCTTFGKVTYTHRVKPLLFFFNVNVEMIKTHITEF